MITELKENEVFVFGSNEAGIHGAGAAYQALRQFGAKLGMGFGHHEQTFAIPTKDWNVQTLPLHVIKFYVQRFLEYTKTREDLVFLVTPIGTGLAGYTAEDIAPLFKTASWLQNVVLPKEFMKVLKERYNNV